jgi:hypothetical protein
LGSQDVLQGLFDKLCALSHAVKSRDIKDLSKDLPNDTLV